MRDAVIGGGISGLSCAWRRAQSDTAVETTLFKASETFGGHADTVDITLGAIARAVDIGALVFTHEHVSETRRALRGTRRSDDRN
ncbi:MULTISPECIES: NAD(P)-binding protein [unclassified Caballeronia]|uniref:NAD(P)-binding protein n=1 Tax=unclassified Caballeronia TaxID=2646786 RepID=UPI003857313A